MAGRPNYAGFLDLDSAPSLLPVLEDYVAKYKGSGGPLRLFKPALPLLVETPPAIIDCCIYANSKAGAILAFAKHCASTGVKDPLAVSMWKPLIGTGMCPLTVLFNLMVFSTASPASLSDQPLWCVIVEVTRQDLVLMDDHDFSKKFQAGLVQPANVIGSVCPAEVVWVPSPNTGYSSA